MSHFELTKDDKVKLTIKHLADKYGEDKFVIKDYWVADLLSIGLADTSEKCLIYFSVYEKDQHEFYVSLENLNKEDDGLPYEPAGDFDQVSLERLEHLFLKHLRINSNREERY